MDVGVRHLHTEHGYTHPLAGHCGLKCCCNLAGECPKAAVGLAVKREDVVFFGVLRDYERVSERQGADVKEGIEVFALRYLVGRNLAQGDFGNP